MSPSHLIIQIDAELRWKISARACFNSVYHVVPQALGQLLVALDGEVEAVVGEEGHVDFSALTRETKTSPSAGECVTFVPPFPAWPSQNQELQLPHS